MTTPASFQDPSPKAPRPGFSPVIVGATEEWTPAFAGVTILLGLRSGVLQDPSPPSGLSPLVTRHDPPHELIEQRHRERGVPMEGTVDHPLRDQLGSGRSH